VNPYRWDLVDPFLFYGRGGTVAHLVDRLLAGDRFAVAGGRRMGKTTLLRRLELELARIEATGGLIVMPVFVDLAELYGGSAEEAYGLLARRTRAAAQAAHLPTDDSDVTSGPELAESLQALLEATRRLGRLQLVFLFDEIERVPLNTWGGGFLAYWRMLLNNRGELSRCLSAVFSGAGGIYRIAQDAGSPLGNILAWHELELFSYEETARLVREPSGNIWPDPLVDRIYEASGGHPCLIQYLMQRVCDGELSLRSGQAPSASSGAVPSVAREQAPAADSAQDAWIESVASAEQRFLREHATIFSSWWQGFDETARSIYASLADGGPVPEGELIARSSATGKRALDVLSHTGVVRWDRSARTVQAAGTLFNTWARERALPGRELSWQTRRPAADEVAGTGPIGVGRRIGTVLFTDIVSSTRLTAELGDRSWLELVSVHNTRVRETLAIFRGREVKTTGDGFLALFDAPAAAIRCAVSIASAVRPLGLEVRAGLHAGEYEAIGDDVMGIAISYAAWVMSRARGGEVFVSDTVRALVAGSGIRFVDRGSHRVKGSRERHRLFAVDYEPETWQLSLP
jgi:class 3 adenylate cyclase